MTDRRGPGLGQDFWILNRDLVIKEAHVRAGEVLDHMFLIAVEPPAEIVPGPLVYTDGIDDQRISLPMADSFPVELGIRILAMRMPIQGDDPPVVVQFVQLCQLAWGLNQLYGI